MTKALALRSDRPKPLMTRELRKRKNFGLRELAKVHAPWMLLPTSILGLGASITLIVLGDPTLYDLIGGVSCGASVLGGIGSIGWMIDIEDGGSRKYNERAFDVLGDRSRRGRAHRDDDKARLKELDHKYSRYSVRVERDGTNISMYILEHFYLGPGLLPWKSRKTKKGGGGDDFRQDHHIAQVVRLTNPTFETLMDNLTVMEMTAKELEENAYRQAVKVHKIDCMALAMQPPPANARTRARIMAHRHTTLLEEEQELQAQLEKYE